MDESTNLRATSEVEKPKSGEMYTETVTLLTTSFDVRKLHLVEEAAKLFTETAKKNGVTLADKPRLVKINHRVGKSAEYTFEAKAK